MESKTLPVYQIEIERFCQRVQARFEPDCIILHGSVARGTHTAASDVDIIVVGGSLPENFLVRLYELNRLRDAAAPIEVVGYTLAEWRQMMSRFHLTTLEALQWGIPLYGQTLFASWRQKLITWKAQGLKRDEKGWSIPTRLRQTPETGQVRDGGQIRPGGAVKRPATARG